MIKKPFFSIVIPTYNSADKLNRALDSVNKQSFRDFEVIVCDDGSSDHTKQVVDYYCDKLSLQYRREENWGGPARPKNNGLKISQGKYIAFLDADDWWYPEKLKIVKDSLFNVDIAYHDLDIFSPRGKKIFKKVKGRHLKKPVFVDLLKNENALTTSGVVAKKDIIERVGGFEEGFLTCVEDFDLWLKIARITDNFLYIPKNLGAYWIESGSVSEASEKIAERLEFVYRKHFDFLADEDKKQAETIMNYLIGRTKQKIGLLKEALELFKKSAKSRNLKFRIKSICWVVIINLSLIFRRLNINKLDKELENG